MKGAGNQQDYGMRIYDPRIGKFLSVDPLTPTSDGTSFAGYLNEKNQTVEAAVQELQEFASSWKYKLWSFGNYLKGQHDDDPVGFNLKLTTTLLTMSAMSAVEPVMYGRVPNSSTVTQESMSSLGTLRFVSKITTNLKGVPYPQIFVEGYGLVPFPSGPYSPNNSSFLRSQFTPALKNEFKTWWISQGRTWPIAPEGSVINIQLRSSFFWKL